METLEEARDNCGLLLTSPPCKETSVGCLHSLVNEHAWIPGSLAPFHGSQSGLTCAAEFKDTLCRECDVSFCLLVCVCSLA